MLPGVGAGWAGSTGRAATLVPWRDGDATVRTCHAAMLGIATLQYQPLFDKIVECSPDWLIAGQAHACMAGMKLALDMYWKAYTLTLM